MRLSIGTVYNILVPVGAPLLDQEQRGSTITRQTAADFSAANPKLMAPGNAPVMTAGQGAGTYASIMPFANSAPSVPSAPALPAPSAALAQQIVTTTKAADIDAHTAAVRSATEKNIAAGMQPMDAAMKGQTDVANFYAKLQAATPEQRQQFYAMSDTLAARDQAAGAKQVADAVTKATAANIAAGMSADAARAKAEADAQAFFTKLQNATPEQLAKFKQFSEGAAAARQTAAAATQAAKKMESDSVKKAARMVISRGRVAVPVKQLPGNRNWKKK